MERPPTGPAERESGGGPPEYDFVWRQEEGAVEVLVGERSFFFRLDPKTNTPVRVRLDGRPVPKETYRKVFRCAAEALRSLKREEAKGAEDPSKRVLKKGSEQFELFH